MSDHSDRDIAILNDIRSYLRITAASSSRDVASKVIDTQEKANIYSKMDGKTSTFQIADATGVPQRTVGNWAEDFVKSGLASPPNEFFRSHRALFSLTELAVDISLLKKRKKKEEMTESPPAAKLDTVPDTEPQGGQKDG